MLWHEKEKTCLGVFYSIPPLLPPPFLIFLRVEKNNNAQLRIKFSQIIQKQDISNAVCKQYVYIYKDMAYYSIIYIK